MGPKKSSRSHPMRGMLKIFILIIIIIIGIMVLRPDRSKVQDSSDIPEVDETAVFVPVDSARPACTETIVTEERDVIVPVRRTEEIFKERNRTITPKYEVSSIYRRGEYYYTWRYDQFLTLIDSIEFTGWMEGSGLASFDVSPSSDASGIDPAGGHITITNLHDENANFTVVRDLFRTDGDAVGFGVGTVVVEIPPKENRTVEFDRGIACYMLSSSVTDEIMPLFIDFIKSHRISDDDGVVFAKDGRMWGCHRARYEVKAHKRTVTYVEKVTIDRMENVTEKREFNRIVRECET